MNSDKPTKYSNTPINCRGSDGKCHEVIKKNDQWLIMVDGRFEKVEEHMNSRNETYFECADGTTLTPTDGF